MADCFIDCGACGDCGGDCSCCECCVGDTNMMNVETGGSNEDCCLCCEGGDISLTGGGRGTNNTIEQRQAQEEMGQFDSIGGFLFTFIFLLGCVSHPLLINYKNNNTEPTSATITMYPTITPWYHDQDSSDYEYYPQSHHHHNSTVHPTASFVPSPSPQQNESSWWNDLSDAFSFPSSSYSNP